MPKAALLLIDPQKDFIEANGALSVPGAIQDTQRTITFIENNTLSLDAIYVTLDYHQVDHIAHADWWVNAQDQEPAPFSNITAQDVADGKWKAKNPQLQAHSLAYLQKLEAQGKYQHTIWPKHCIQDTPGCELPDNLKAALKKWEQSTGKIVHYVHKGMSAMTEQFSALKAEVPQEDDAATELNVPLIKELDNYDQIIIAGQALSHCVANTTEDLIKNIQLPGKVRLLTDCCSNVAGCKEMGDKFQQKAIEKGMGLITSAVTLSSASQSSSARRDFTGKNDKNEGDPLLGASINDDQDKQKKKSSCCILV